MARYNAKELFKEARRRRVFRTAGLYIVGAWVVVQIALAAFPALSISEAAIRYVWVAAMLGFPLAIVFGWQYDIRGGRVVRTTSSPHDAPLSLTRPDFLLLGTLGAIATVILASSLWEISSTQPQQTASYSPTEVDSRSVAVLPFANMSGDQQNEYFSDGLTETLLHMLAQLKDLKVAARTSSFAFKGQNTDIRSVAAALSVAHVLEGSVQKAGDRIRVTAQLIRAEDGFHVWSQNFDRTLDDIFAVQDEISNHVAAALGSSLLTVQETGIQNIDTEDFSAFDLYLQALEQQNINSNEALLRADQLFTAALDKDPDFVDAKIGLARNHIWNRWKSAVRHSEAKEYRAAHVLVGEVLAQRPENLSAQVMDLLLQFLIGNTEHDNWGWDESLYPLVDEMLLLAGHGSIDSFLTRILVEILSVDREAEALDLLRTSLETDPLNIELLWAQARLYRHSDRPQEAKQPLLTALTLAPDNSELQLELGWLAFSQENFIEGMDWTRQAQLADPERPEIISMIGSMFYRFGLLQEGDFWFDRLRSVAPDQINLIFDLEILAAAAAEDQDRLLAVLERAMPLVLNAEVDYFLPTVYYPSIMSAHGRSQEALDYLTELIPELQDYSKLIVDNRFSQYIQLISFNLQRDVMDRESFQQLAVSFAGVVAENYPDWRGNVGTINEVLMEEFLGNHDRRVPLLVKSYADWPMFDGQWLQLQIYPWFQELRNDPAVAAAIEEYEQKKVRIADELREMLKQPEWRH